MPALPIAIGSDDFGDYNFELTFPEGLDIDLDHGAGIWQVNGFPPIPSAFSYVSFQSWGGLALTLYHGTNPGATSGTIKYIPNEYPLRLVSGYEYPAFEIPWSLA